MLFECSFSFTKSSPASSQSICASIAAATCGMALSREKLDPTVLILECAPDGGQVVGWELTGAAGLSKDGSHGQAPHLQHRIQASGRSRIHCRRDAACAGEASRSL